MSESKNSQDLCSEIHRLLAFLKSHGPHALKSPEGKPFKELAKKIIANPYSQELNTIQALLTYGFPLIPYDCLFLKKATEYLEAPESLNIRKWCVRNRSYRKTGTLDLRREAFLTKIGFEWNGYHKLEKRWYTYFEELKKEKVYLGGLYLDSSKKLRYWMNRVRSYRETLSKKQIDDLNAIGFVWDARKGMREDGLRELKLFKAKYSHCKVPHKCNEFPRASKLLLVARTHYKNGALPKDQEEILKSLGVNLNPPITRGELRLAQLIDIYKRHGKIVHSYKSNRGFALARWVLLQRKSWDRLDPVFRQQLEQMGVKKYSPRRSKTGIRGLYIKSNPQGLPVYTAYVNFNGVKRVRSFSSVVYGKKGAEKLAKAELKKMRVTAIPHRLPHYSSPR